ncbi:MAG: M3 family oligoendopeptidase [Oscillospiraceae bacterium]|nr:M3 family oligoendopeptidase [Oscillospiraceae bacterium]
MKFSEMPYIRPDQDAIWERGNELAQRMEAAQSAQEQIDAIDGLQKLMGNVGTLRTIAEIRHTIDTRDAFYDRENDFYDELGPKLEELGQRVNQAILDSPYREALGEHYGKLLLTNIEISARSFKPEMVELMQRENKLTSEYQKLYASAVVEFEGQKMPLPKLGPYKQNPDRAVRRAAYETEGGFFDAHREELDHIYDELVKNRTAQAKMLGHENYLQLGYDRMGRNCYGIPQVEEFRRQIAEELVPVVSRVKKAQEQRLGVDKLRFYDDVIVFPDGNPKPQGTPDDILAAGVRMYHELSPETAEFIDHMYQNELLDVLSKDGKAPGGYCTHIYDYKSPFIFSNFNGTSGDVDVLTHEAGHAFAAWRNMSKGRIEALIWPTMEACECHSMSMEFLTSPWHRLFFGDATRKYDLAHAEQSLTFIPYGCLVDEFQHRMYAEPDLSPEQRNQVWMELEHKFRPWVDFDGLPFYGRGAGWQRQLHIYQHPLYYIDYCMAQTVAFQFWMVSLRDREDAWKRYLAFTDKGGTETFEELVRGAGLKVPYDPGCVKEVGEAVERWLLENRD